MKLELKHIAPYLPYGLKWSLQELKTFTMSGLSGGTLYTNEGSVLCWAKHEEFPQALFPILRPLSDLTKEIEHNGERLVPIDAILRKVDQFYPFECFEQDKKWILMDKYDALKNLPFEKIQLLFEWHFDVFGLIEQGLAIDINTLD